MCEALPPTLERIVRIYLPWYLGIEALWYKNYPSGAPSQPREKGPVGPVGLAREGFSYFGTSLVGCLAAMSAISASLGAAWLLYWWPGWLYARFGVPKYRYFGGPGIPKAWQK